LVDSAVLTQYQRVTDRHRHKPDDGNSSLTASRGQKLNHVNMDIDILWCKMFTLGFIWSNNWYYRQ